MRINVFLDVYFFLSGTKMVQFFKKIAKKVLSPYVVSRTLISLKENATRNSFFTQPTFGKIKILVFFCPDYGNLGDVGIYIAQKKFLEENLPDFESIDIPVNKTLDGISWFRNRVNNNDLIVMSGGGFFGDLYPLMEHYRQMIVKYFPSISIISFPQSTFFSDTKKGLKLLNRSVNIYNDHPDLTLIGRDLSSFRFMQKNFPECYTLCLPDIVLSMSEIPETAARKGIGFIWRKDFESGVSIDAKTGIEDVLKRIFTEYKHFDTSIRTEDLSIQNLIQNYNHLIEVIKSCELVVTDRLHGMIFCYITQTPCIAINDKNSKISNSYNTWFKEVSFIEMFSHDFDLEKIISFIKTIDEILKERNLSIDFDAEFKLLHDVLLSKVK